MSRNELNGLLAAHRLLPRRGRTGACATETVYDEGGMRERIEHVPLGVVGQHLGLELSLVRRLQRDRAGAADRQRRALQAVRVRHAHRAWRSRACCTRPACRATCSCRWSARARSAPRCWSRTIDGLFFTGSLRHRARASRRRWARASSSCSWSWAARTRPTSATTPIRRPPPNRWPTARCTTPARAAARSSASTCTRRSTMPSSPPSSRRCKGFKVGDPMSDDTYIGAITRAPQLDVLDAQVADAKAKGATLLHRRQRAARPRQLVRAHGVQQRRPQHGADARGKLRPRHRHPEGARRRGSGAPDERHPLRPHGRRLHARRASARDAVLARVNAGSVYWNCCDRVSPRLPWSGFGDSGVGLTLSTYGIQAFTRPKAWHLRQV